MNKRLMTIGLLLTAASSAFGQGPNPYGIKYVTYSIHEDPQDPESEVVFTIKLKLVADQIEEDQVGWDVKRVTIEQFGEDSRIWIDQPPNVDTADELWWVQHADMENPVAADFVQPPRLFGVANAQAQEYDDLEYDIVGLVYTPPPAPEQPPFGSETGALNYLFELEYADEPLSQSTSTDTNTEVGE